MSSLVTATPIPSPSAAIPLSCLPRSDRRSEESYRFPSPRSRRPSLSMSSSLPLPTDENGLLLPPSRSRAPEVPLGLSADNWSSSSRCWMKPDADSESIPTPCPLGTPIAQVSPTALHCSDSCSPSPFTPASRRNRVNANPHPASRRERPKLAPWYAPSCDASNVASLWPRAALSPASRPSSANRSCSFLASPDCSLASIAEESHPAHDRSSEAPTPAGRPHDATTLSPSPSGALHHSSGFLRRDRLVLIPSPTASPLEIGTSDVVFPIPSASTEPGLPMVSLSLRSASAAAIIADPDGLSTEWTSVESTGGLRTSTHPTTTTLTACVSPKAPRTRDTSGTKTTPPRRLISVASSSNSCSVTADGLRGASTPTGPDLLLPNDPLDRALAAPPVLLLRDRSSEV